MVMPDYTSLCPKAYLSDRDRTREGVGENTRVGQICANSSLP